MTINVIAIPDNGWDDYLFDSKCFGVWVYANEEEHNDSCFDKYKLHFVTYQVFPSPELEAHLKSIEAAAKLQPNYYEDEAKGEYLDEVERSYPEYEFDFIDMADADESESLICMEEIDWEAYRAEQSRLTEAWQQQSTDSVVADAIEGVLESLRCNGGYPDYIRLSGIAQGSPVSEFSQSDYRFIKGAVQVEVQRPASGGFLLKAIVDSKYGWNNHTQRYFGCTESQARQKFWEYLQSQGVEPVEAE